MSRRNWPEIHDFDKWPVYGHAECLIYFLIKVLSARIQLDWPWFPEWAYAGIFAVAVRFQNQEQFWISHQKNQFFCFFKILKNELVRYGQKRCFVNFIKDLMVLLLDQWRPNNGTHVYRTRRTPNPWLATTTQGWYPRLINAELVLRCIGTRTNIPWRDLILSVNISTLGRLR